MNNVPEKKRMLPVTSDIVHGLGHGEDIDGRGRGGDAAPRGQAESTRGAFSLGDNVAALLINLPRGCGLEKGGVQIAEDDVLWEVLGSHPDGYLVPEAQDTGMGPGVGFRKKGQVEVLVATEVQAESTDSSCFQSFMICQMKGQREFGHMFRRDDLIGFIGIAHPYKYVLCTESLDPV